MDAQNHINTYDESPLGNMFENLVDMSNPIDPYKGWKPMLAVSWKRLNETTFQFKLRENVKFHNGEPFDAEAVKFSVDRLLGRVDKDFLPPTVAWHAYVDQRLPPGSGHREHTPEDDGGRHDDQRRAQADESREPECLPFPGAQREHVPGVTRSVLSAAPAAAARRTRSSP